jgi:hypothetical protein
VHGDIDGEEGVGGVNGARRQGEIRSVYVHVMEKTNSAQLVHHIFLDLPGSSCENEGEKWPDQRLGWTWAKCSLQRGIAIQWTKFNR